MERSDRIPATPSLASPNSRRISGRRFSPGNASAVRWLAQPQSGYSELRAKITEIKFFSLDSLLGDL